MIKILNKPDSYIIVLPDNNKIELFKNDINESKKLLEMIIYSLGLNTEDEKLQIVVK